MSEFGAWAYRPDGTERFGPQSQTVKRLGSLTISSSNSPGSVTDARFTAYSGHRGFWAVVESTAGTAIPPNAPVITLAGNTLSWSYPAGVTQVSQKIIYGITGTR